MDQGNDGFRCDSGYEAEREEAVSAVTAVDDLSYPVLAVGDQIGLDAFRDAASLQTPNSLAVRRGVYKSLLLVDSRGVPYSIANVEVFGGAGPFWGLRFMKSRRLRVRLTIERRDPMTLDQVKRLVVEKFGKCLKCGIQHRTETRVSFKGRY